MSAVDAQPITLGAQERELIATLWKGSWVVFGVLSLGALALVNLHSALSVVLGGVVALVNLQLLQKSIFKCLTPPLGKKVLYKMLFRYYIRFAATAALLAVLVWRGWAEPLGLLVGLSVVVIAIFLWGFLTARKLTKEAA